MDNPDLIFVPVVLIAAAIGIIILCRPIYLWFWKIDERLKEQRKTNALLRELIDKK